MRSVANLGRAKLSASACMALLCVLLLVAGANASAASERRVRFGREQTKARVSGRLKGINDSLIFVARARGGQRMRVTIVRSSGPVHCAVTSPSGEDEGQPGTGTIFDEALKQTGLYRIRVTESQMGEQWRGSVLLEIEIK
ncbi:MAG: hypothetical protein ACJ74Q_06410 [Pyrinomonadaceae bacterium]